jgi:hypothetical protein
MVHVPDDLLMAFVDGELSPEERNWLEGVLAVDADLRRRLEPFAITRAALPVIFDAPLHAPIPDRLIDTIRMAGRAESAAPRVSPVGQTASRRPAVPARAGWLETLFPMGFGAPALGYAAVLMIGLSGGWFVKAALDSAGSSAQSLVASDGAGLFASGYLQKALDRQPSGKELPVPGQSSNVRAVRTFRGTDGVFCRQYQVRDAAGRALDGFACREEGGKWRLTFNSKSDGQGGAMAGGVATEASHGSDDAIVSPEIRAEIARIDGEVATNEEEAFLIANGWALNAQSSPAPGNK